MYDKQKWIDLGIKLLQLVLITVLGWLGVSRVGSNVEATRENTETMKQVYGLKPSGR